jgi:hypothetical protein
MDILGIFFLVLVPIMLVLTWIGARMVGRMRPNNIERRDREDTPLIPTPDEDGPLI